MCRRVRKSYSVGVMSSGGLLCTMAAIRCGFTPTWGTEIDEKLAELWVKLTKAKCLGDTFKVDFTDKGKKVVYLKSDQPCPDCEREGVFINSVGRRSCMLNPRLGLGWRFPLRYT